MSYAERLIRDDFLWVALMNGIAGHRKKNSNTRFISICCPMCVRRGESADRKFRCGLKNDKGIGIHCFNCGFKTRWKPGEPLSNNMKNFLGAIGIEEIEVKRLAHRAFTLSAMVQSSPEAQALADIELVMKFPPRGLPKGSQSFETWAAKSCLDPNFIATAEYVFGRGADIAGATTYFWTPEPGRHNLNRRVIIPFYHEGNIVGYTGRTIDKGEKERYHSEFASDYLFNSAVMYDRRRPFILLCEGVFDAIAMDAVGTLGSRLNERQIAWIESFGKEIIVLPDRDKKGDILIEIALKRGWKVAFPALGPSMASRNWWETDVKDAAEATKRYGRLYTLTSVLKSATSSALEINMKRKVFMVEEV